MKINPIQTDTITSKTTQPMFRGFPAEKITRFFTKDVGEAQSIAFDIAGKALLVPLVIMFNGFSKQSKEDRKYSAIKNPIAATIQLGLEVPIFYGASRFIRNAANNGLLDKTADFSYNAKAAKDTFLDSLGDIVKSDPGVGDKVKSLTGMLDKKRTTGQAMRGFKQIITNSSSTLKNETETAFKNFKTVDKRLFLMESLFSFVIAFLAIPIMCKIENWIHPKIMKALDNHKQKKIAQKTQNTRTRGSDG